MSEPPRRPQWPYFSAQQQPPAPPPVVFTPMYVVPTVSTQAPMPPAAPPGRRPATLVVAFLLVLAELAAGVSGVVLLAARLDHLRTMSPAYLDAPLVDMLQIGIVYVAAVWTAFWIAACLPFAVLAYRGREWARITLTVVLVVKAIANLGGHRIVFRLAIAALGFYGLMGTAALVLAITMAVADVLAVALLWCRPTSTWFTATGAHRAYQRSLR